MGAPKTRTGKRSADEAPPSADASEPNALERMRTLIGERPDRDDREALQAYQGRTLQANLLAGDGVEGDAMRLRLRAEWTWAERRLKQLAPPAIPAPPPPSVDARPLDLAEAAIAISRAARWGSADDLARLLLELPVERVQCASVDDAEEMLSALQGAGRRQIPADARPHGKALLAACEQRCRQIDGEGLRVWLTEAWHLHHYAQDRQHYAHLDAELIRHLAALERSHVDACRVEDVVERVGRLARTVRPDAKGRRAGHPSIAIIDWCDARLTRLKREAEAGAEGLAELAALVEHDEDLVDGDPPPGERTVTPRHGVVRTEPPIRPDRPAEQPAKTPRKPPARRKPRIEADEPAAGRRADLPLEAIEIRLEALDESPDNPRQTYDETALAELAASIAELGVLQPLLVRPAGFERWQVVCGHRRLRAARLAGVEAVPCVVRPLRDDEASACRIVENLQRVDLPPLDEADALVALAARWSEDEIASRLGRSERWVRGRLSLAQLSEHYRTLLRDERLPLGGALMLAALPVARRDQLEQVFALDRTMWRQGSPGLQPYVWTVQEVRMQAQGCYLSAATWDLGDETLGGRGACAGCPYRTAAQHELWAMATDDDRCLDTACWDEKRKSWAARTALAEGAVRVDAPWSRKEGELVRASEFAFADDEDERSWADVAPEGIEIVWAYDEKSTSAMPTPCYRVADLREALPDAPWSLPTTVPYTESEEYKAQRRREAERKAALDEVGNRLAAWAEERTWAELAPLVAVTLLREPGVISSSSEAQVALINGALRAAQGWHGFDPRWLEAAGLEAPASDEDDEDDAELEDDAP